MAKGIQLTEQKPPTSQLAHFHIQAFGNKIEYSTFYNDREENQDTVWDLNHSSIDELQDKNKINKDEEQKQDGQKAGALSIDLNKIKKPFNDRKSLVNISQEHENESVFDLTHSNTEMLVFTDRSISEEF